MMMMMMMNMNLNMNSDTGLDVFLANVSLFKMMILGHHHGIFSTAKCHPKRHHISLFAEVVSFLKLLG